MLILFGIHYSYNRYLAVAARVVRRSLKEDQRLAAEKRGEMDLRFAKWEVSHLFQQFLYWGHSPFERRISGDMTCLDEAGGGWWWERSDREIMFGVCCHGID